MKIGDVVAVAFRSEILIDVLEGRVVTVKDAGFVALIDLLAGHTTTADRRFQDEGLSWARGWDNEATDALRVAQALR